MIEKDSDRTHIYRLYLILGILFIAASIICRVDAGFFIVLLLWFLLLGYCLINLERSIVVICFLLTFFIFLLGGYFTYQYFGYEKNIVVFEEEITKHIYVALGTALAGLFLGVMEFNNEYLNTTETNIIRKSGNEDYISVMQFVSKCGFYITIVPYFIAEIYHVHASWAGGYADIYLNEASAALPYPFRLVAYTCPVFLFLFLSTLPSKNEVVFPITLFFVYSVVTLLSGQRSTFVINMLLIFAYCVFRNNNSDNEVWLSKRLILIIIVMLPLGLIGLNMVGYVRFGNDAENTGILNMLFDTLTSQGISISVIGYERVFREAIPDKIYSLGGTIEFLKSNPISAHLFHTASYSGQNAARALNGNSFAHIISYLVLPWGYERGRGLGSCYIAECYHDFGYIWVFFVSVIYGKILKACSKFTEKSVPERFIILNMFYSLAMAPRGLTDAFISNLLVVQVWFAVFATIIITNILFHRYMIQVDYREGIHEKESWRIS